MCWLILTTKLIGWKKNSYWKWQGCYTWTYQNCGYLHTTYIRQKIPEWKGEWSWGSTPSWGTTLSIDDYYEMESHFSWRLAISRLSMPHCMIMQPWVAMGMCSTNLSQWIKKKKNLKLEGKVGMKSGVEGLGAYTIKIHCIYLRIFQILNFFKKKYLGH